MGQTDRKVLVALSGGVDSAVCVQLLREQGFTVSALVLRFSDAHDKAVAAARLAADQLGVPLTVRDCSDAFRREVIAPFCAEYCAGRTPNPCLVCNPRVKFRQLCEAADEMGIFFVASGHYARIAQEGEVFFPRRAVSEARDQSYMLYRLPQEMLRRLLLPVGEFEKPEIRRRAAALGLAAASAPDSQEICFPPTSSGRDTTALPATSSPRTGRSSDHIRGSCGTPSASGAGSASRWAGRSLCAGFCRAATFCSAMQARSFMPPSR